MDSVERQNKEKRRLYSLEEAAGYLNISIWTVREYIWKGDLPSVRLGRRVLLDIRDLDRFIENSKEVIDH